MRSRQRIWNHSPDQRPSVDYRRIRKKYLKRISTLDESVRNLDRLVSAGKPFSHIRIGDIEAAFLTVPFCETDEVSEIKQKLWWCGVDPDDIPDTAPFLEVINKATVASIHSPLVNNEPFWWASTYDMLNLTGLWKSRGRWDEVHAIYKYAADENGLFPRLAGHKVVLVGGKVDVFYRYFFRHPHYRESFPWLGLEKINIADVIKTPDLPDFCMNSKSEIVAQVRKTYRLKPDVYLMSCGILAKYLTVMVTEESGATGLDVGNAIESMMNVGNKRPFMKRFAEYRHSEYEFTIGSHMRITAIERKE
jgi:hypothetical protein